MASLGFSFLWGPAIGTLIQPFSSANLALVCLFCRVSVTGPKRVERLTPRWHPEEASHVDIQQTNSAAHATVVQIGRAASLGLEKKHTWATLLLHGLASPLWTITKSLHLRTPVCRELPFWEAAPLWTEGWRLELCPVTSARRLTLDLSFVFCSPVLIGVAGLSPEWLPSSRRIMLCFLAVTHSVSVRQNRFLDITEPLSRMATSILLEYV